MTFGDLSQRFTTNFGLTSVPFSTPTRVAAILLWACLLLPSLASAVTPYEKWADELGIDMDVSYDAIRTMDVEGQSFQATERKAPGKMYTEVNMGQMKSGVILREDLNKSYLLMPTMGMYREETLEGGLIQSANGMEFSEIEKAGREEISGYDSTKYKVRFKDNEGKGAGFIWVADEGVPVKMDMIYSSRKMKGQRVTMTLTELNLREQDPKWFEVPEGLKPMGGMGGLGAILSGNAAAGQNTEPASPQADDPEMSEDDKRAAARQACLAEAATRAQQEQEKAEKKRGLGRLMRSVSRTARRFGVDGVSEVTRDVYDANATVQDAQVIAEELGISENDVEDCFDRNP